MRTPQHVIAALGAALALAACGASLGGIGRTGNGLPLPGGGTVDPAGRGPAGPGGAGPAGTGPDSQFFRRARDRRAVVGGGDLASRRVCRTGSWPRGWVAVAYERGGDGCAGVRGDSLATAAVLVRYSGRPLDTRLDICADQAVPVGWSPVPDEAPGDPGACPGAARGDRPTVRRVRRTS